MNIIKLDGKKYIVKKVTRYHGGETEVKVILYDEKEYDKLIGDIVKRLKSAVNPEKLLKQVLGKYEYSEIKAIHKTLQDKRIKPKAEEACYEIKIGKKHVVQLLD